MYALNRYHFDINTYHRLLETGCFGENARLELLDGEILHMAAVGRLHAHYTRRLIRLL